MKKEVLLFVVILLIASIGQVAADLYLPSLPAIAKGLSSKINDVQWSVSLYMWGFAGSQLIYGPLSDGIGRKPPLLFGLVLLLLSSILCLLSPNISWFNIARCLQGIGAGAGLALSRAILRDVYSDTHLARFSSYLAVGSITMIASAPLLGGYLQHIWGWHANFIFLTLYTAAILITVIFKLPETNIHQNKQHLKLKQWGTNLTILAKNTTFVAPAIIIFVSYAGTLGWLTVGPVLLQVQAGLTPIEFGWIGLITGLAYGIGAITNGKLLAKYGMQKMMMKGITLMLIGAVLMLLLALIFKSVNAIIIVIPMAIFTGGTGFVFANSFAIATGPFSKMAGIAGSLFGFMQILGGAIMSGFLAQIDEKTQLSLALALLGCALVAWGSLWKLKRQ